MYASAFVLSEEGASIQLEMSPLSLPELLSFTLLATIFVSHSHAFSWSRAALTDNDDARFSVDLSDGRSPVVCLNSDIKPLL